MEETHLTASMMTKVPPIDLEAAMVVHVHQLMHNCALHVLLAEKMTST
jgi:hypothetical protein